MLQEAKEAVKDAAGDVKDNVKGEADADRQTTSAQQQVAGHLMEVLVCCCHALSGPCQL